jgi:hypothetical protein
MCIQLGNKVYLLKISNMSVEEFKSSVGDAEYNPKLVEFIETVFRFVSKTNELKMAPELIFYDTLQMPMNPKYCAEGQRCENVKCTYYHGFSNNKFNVFFNPPSECIPDGQDFTYFDQLILHIFSDYLDSTDSDMPYSQFLEIKQRRDLEK